MVNSDIFAEGIEHVRVYHQVLWLQVTKTTNNVCEHIADFYSMCTYNNQRKS